MRRPNRTLSIFTLSALDVLAMSTGVFVLLVVLMMPYYRMTFDAGAEMEGVRTSTRELQAAIRQAERAAADDLAAAETARLRADETMRAAAVARAQAMALSREAAAVAAAVTTPGAAGAQGVAPAARQPRRTAIIDQLDIVFVIDASGSMERVLRDLAQSLTAIVRVLQRLVPSLRVGIVAYRDYDVGGWVVNPLPLTPTGSQLTVVTGFASNLRAAKAGGGTSTEAMLEGLRTASQMNFRPEAQQTLMVIGDAAAHPSEQAETLQLARSFAASGATRQLSTLFVTTEAFRRYGRGDRAFFARLAEAGGGVFTDHRGEMLESVLLSIFDG